MASDRRLCVVFPYDMHWPSLAVYQRILMLARRYGVTLMTRSDAIVGTDIEQNATVVRSPIRTGRLYPDLLLFYTWLPLQLARLALRRELDVLYTFRDMSSLFGLPCRRLVRNRWIADIFDDPALELRKHEAINPQSLKVRALQRLISMLQRCLPHADLVITIGTDSNEGLPAIMTAEYGVPRSRMLAVPNGVDLSEVKPNGRGNPSDDYSLFYVGSVGTQQGMAVLLEAFDKLLDRVPRARLRVAGPFTGAEEDRYAAELDRRRSAVEYLGPTHPRDVRRLIEQSDVCIYPFLNWRANNVVFPVKVCEYLALGKPVVASRLYGVSEMVRDGENGLLVEPGDAAALCEALYRLYRDPDLRRRLGERARPSVAKFDWSTIHAAIGDRIDQVLAGARP